MQKSIYFCCTLCVFLSAFAFANAQAFLKTTPPGKKITFTEMQKRFEEWAKKTDLSKTKNWKYYKRWEKDMEGKTNGRGEPADPALYINEAIRVAGEKLSAPSTHFSQAAWTTGRALCLARKPDRLYGKRHRADQLHCFSSHSSLHLFCGSSAGRPVENYKRWSQLDSPHR